jgi:dihydroorotate dehydrogenase electron transfer subunit
MGKKILQVQNKIVTQARLSNEYYKLILESPEIAAYSLPGQFLEIKVSDGIDPFLRRPFSVHRSTESNIEILYEVVGKGSRMLSQKKPGEYLDIIGPLGRGFTFREPKTENRVPILIAGGMGVAPVFFLAEKLVARHWKTPLILIGAKTKGHILCVKDFKKLGCTVKVATDDGSEGFKGRVTDLLKVLVSTMDYRLWTIFACGPKPMLQALTHIAGHYALPAQISLEAHMACGVGACLGCVIKTPTGYQRVCKDGPVFNAGEIIW